MSQETRKKIAYSGAGKVLAKVLRNLVFKNSRAHWVQDWFAGHKTMASLPR